MERKKKKRKQTKERVETKYLPNGWPFLGTKKTSLTKFSLLLTLMGRDIQ